MTVSPAMASYVCNVTQRVSEFWIRGLVDASVPLSTIEDLVSMITACPESASSAIPDAKLV